MDPIRFATALIAFCYATRGSVTSWGRTEKRNAAVGGVPTSMHRQFLGADVVYDEPIAVDFAQQTARRFGLKVVRESDHDHLQPL